MNTDTARASEAMPLNHLLARQVAVCYSDHPFYSRLMRRSHLAPEDVTTTEDLRRLPVTTKRDFLDDPESFVLRGSHLPVEERTIWDVVYTTGTTSGAPAPVYTTVADHLRFLRTAARQAESLGLRRGDRMVSLFPLTKYPTGAAVRVAAEASACGVSVVAALPGRSLEPADRLPRSLDDVVDLAARHNPTVLIGIATFLRRFLGRAAEVGAQFPSLRLCRLSGELSSPAFQVDIQERMRAVGASTASVVNRYGSTEQGTGLIECRPNAGFHNTCPDQVFLEAVSADDERLPPGEVGRLAFTHLVRRGTVFLRYAVGDTAAVTSDACPGCGKSGQRLPGQPVRIHDVVKIKGTLIDVSVLQQVLDELDYVEEYQVVVGKDPDDPLSTDRLNVLVATRDATRVRSAAEIANAVRRRCNVTPEVHFVAKDQIYDPLVDAKPVRFVDARIT